jgi:hypothetical protein
VGIARVILVCMEGAAWVDKLSDILFWDVDRSLVDPGKHIRWIIERILERGDYEDWTLLKRNVSKETLQKEYDRLRIDPKSKNFMYRYLYGPDQIPREG